MLWRGQDYLNFVVAHQAVVSTAICMLVDSTRVCWGGEVRLAFLRYAELRGRYRLYQKRQLIRKLVPLDS